MEYVEKKVRAKKYSCKNCGKNFYRYYEADEEVCEVCLSNDVIHINNSDELLEVKLPYVTHKQWDSYNSIEKKNIVSEELKLKKLL